jgi:alkyl sulfatase BDS1-like metallo-beta-lactamase superfamily hydrolase
MALWLSQEWLDEMKGMAESQPERKGASARMQYIVNHVPEEAGGEDIHYYWVLEDGHLNEAALGTLDDAEVTLTQSYTDAKLIQQGKLDANAAFMQGKVKVTGNMAKLMALLPLTNAPEYKKLQQDLQEVTEYPG